MRSAESGAADSIVGEQGPQPPAHRTRAGILAALRVIVAVAILAWLSGLAGIEGILSRIGTCPPDLAFAAFLAALASHGVAAFRLSLLARAQDFPLTKREALALGLAAVFYGLFLPGGSATGWVVRLLRLSRGTSRVGAALQLLAGERLLATATGAGIGVVAGLVMPRAGSPLIIWILLAVTAGAGLLALAVMTIAARQWIAWAERIPVLHRVTAFILARGSLQKRPAPATVIVAVVLSVFAHAMAVVAWLILSRALGLNLDPLSIAWIRSAALVVTMLPATVGGLGLREGAVVYLMSQIGFAAADALALSLLVFAVTVFAVGTLGGLIEACGLLVRRRAAHS